MTPYFLLYTFMICAVLFTWRKNWPTSFWIIGILSIIFIGIRAPSVGADTQGYLSYLQNPSWGYGDEIIERKPEISYQALNLLFHHIGIGDHLFLLLISAISMAGVLFYIHKYSNFANLSLLLFFLIPDLYRQPFFLLRQAIALSFFLFAIHIYISGSKKTWAYLLFAIAISFHVTALLPITIFLIASRVTINSNRLAAFLLFGSMLLGSFQILDLRAAFRLVSSLPFLGLERLAGYSDFLSDDWFVSQKDILFQTAPISLLGFLSFKSTKPDHSQLRTMLVISIILSNLSAMYPMAGRANAYALPILICLIPNAISRAKTKGAILTTVIIIFFLRLNYFAFKQDLLGLSQVRVAPYSINPGFLE